MICRLRTVSQNVVGNPLTIGILALQGDVREHAAIVRDLGADVREIRTAEHLKGIDGLIIPGGESSVMDKLCRIFGLHAPLRDAIASGMPALGTCAGMIMLADRIEDGIEGQKTLGGLDIVVQRNAFGAQRDSFETDLEIEGIEGPPMTVAFIRAPMVKDVGAGVDVIARLANGSIVGVRQGNKMAVAFHPEITGDKRLHQLFLDTVRLRALGSPAVSAT